jgi:exodeoxyribonuclease VIII
MEETGSNETKNSASVSEGTEEIIASTGPAEADCSAVTVSAQSDLNKDDSAEMLYTHLMVDVEALGKKPAPSFQSVQYSSTQRRVIRALSFTKSLASSHRWPGGVPDASTIIFWLKASSEARSEIVMDSAITLSDALQQLDDFITANASNGKDSVQVWGNGATYDNVLLAESFDRAGIPCPWKFWNNRDVRTIVELGKAVGYTPGMRSRL